MSALAISIESNGNLNEVNVSEIIFLVNFMSLSLSLSLFVTRSFYLYRKMIFSTKGSRGCEYKCVRAKNIESDLYNQGPTKILHSMIEWINDNSKCQQKVCLKVDIWTLSTEKCHENNQKQQEKRTQKS